MTDEPTIAVRLTVEQINILIAALELAEVEENLEADEAVYVDLHETLFGLMQEHDPSVSLEDDDGTQAQTGDAT